jgi:L-ascorbate metabolism protein UlaG (beta-lactamase superfamily)
MPRRWAALAAGVLMTTVACSSDEAIQAPGKPYHHLTDGTFRNPPGSPPRTATFGDMWSFLWRRMTSSEKDIAVPADHVLPPAEAVATLQALDGADSVTWVGHASFLLRMSGTWVLTDPYLGEVAGPMGFGPRRYVPPGIAVDALPPIDVLVVSHNHYDHLDAATIDALPNKDRMTVVVPLGLAPFFADRGYKTIVELDWYAGTAVGPVTVTALPAVHFSRRGPFDRNRTLWAGFAIADDRTRVYFAGDTAYGAVFKEIGQRAGPFDLALLPIGAYLPRSIMKASHVTPAEAVQLADDIGAARTIGMHWGTVVLTDEPQFEPPKLFRDAAAQAGWPAEKAGLMKIGETWTLQPGS